MVNFNTIDDLNVNGKVVFVRADLNLPVKDGKVSDTTRVDRFAPTVLDLLAKGAKVVIASHFGRPKGKIVPEMSLKIVQESLEKALNKPVTFVDDCIGEKVKNTVQNMQNGDVILLENLRFYPEEEQNNPEFAKKLAEIADIYINDAFSAAHRGHASTEGIAKQLHNGAGRLMEAELKALDKALGNPKHPVMAIVGGAKVSSKLELLGNLVEKVDKIVIGGGMANTFLFAQGVNVGNSLCEKEMAETANEIMKKANKLGCEIILPTDVVIASKFAEGAEAKTVNLNDVKDKIILDIGKASVINILDKISECKTLIWNGPVGAFEIAPFDRGTIAIAQYVADETKKGRLLSVGGGGDTVAALKKAGIINDLSYVSAAGGAFLEWMEGKTLPGVEAIKKN